MENILITGQSGTGKTLLASGLIREYDVKGYVSIYLDNIEPGKEIKAQIAEALNSGRLVFHIPGATVAARNRIMSQVGGGEFKAVDFCVLTSIEPPEEFDIDFFRVIRTGRS